MKAKTREALEQILTVQKIPVSEKLKIEKAIRQKDEQIAELKEKSAELQKQNTSLEKRVEFLSGMTASAKKKWDKPKRVKSGQAAAVVLISDIHCEETVDPSEVNGLNEYDLSIAERSIKQTFDRALLLLEDARNLVNIRRMVLWLGGDMISGYIHPELQERNSLSPLAACRWVKARLLAGIKMLAEHGGMDTLTILTSHGNHGRDTPKNRSAGEYDRSYEYDMYLSLRNEAEGIRKVEWQVGKGYHNYCDILGHNARFHHGHKVKYGGGVGGIHIPMNKAIYAWNQKIKADLNFCGHFHQWSPFGLESVINGSMIGYNAFAIDIKAQYQPPLQTFCVVDRDRGMTRVLPIFCR
jgi:hypothetical protein